MATKKSRQSTAANFLGELFASAARKSVIEERLPLDERLRLAEEFLDEGEERSAAMSARERMEFAGEQIKEVRDMVSC